MSYRQRSLQVVMYNVCIQIDLKLDTNMVTKILLYWCTKALLTLE